MIGRIFTMLTDAVRNVRKNFLHTLLSILGIVIGVASLVIILSMIDGMEKYALEQVSSTTSLETLQLNAQTTEVVDDVRLPKDSIIYLGYNEFERMLREKQIKGKGLALLTHTSRLSAGDTARSGGVVQFVSRMPDEGVTIVAGQHLDSVKYSHERTPAIINFRGVEALFPGLEPADVVGKLVRYDSVELEVAGVMANQGEKDPVTFVVPISIVPEWYFDKNPPRFFIRAENITEVQVIEKSAREWMESNLGKENDMQVITNQYRVEQINRGFLLFRIIMGLIVGVSVVVGGIGIMNVMIISVTERIREIGIRKAVGAKKKEILMQFLSESVTISGLGSLVGLVVGILLTLGIVPILRALTEAPFQAAFTVNTLIIVGMLALLIGVVFGTYPALKASRLDPVEAIRHE